MLLGAIWKEAIATEPFAIVVKLSPKTMQVVDPEDEEHDIDLAALVAAESVVTATVEMSAEE